MGGSYSRVTLVEPNYSHIYILTLVYRFKPRFMFRPIEF